MTPSAAIWRSLNKMRPGSFAGQTACVTPVSRPARRPRRPCEAELELVHTFVAAFPIKIAPGSTVAKLYVGTTGADYYTLVGTTETMLSDFSDPEYSAFGPDGLIYVLNRALLAPGRGIFQVDPDTGAQTDWDDGTVSSGGHWAVAPRPATGHVYVTDSTEIMLEFDTSGNFVTDHECPAGANSADLDGMAWHNDLLYIMDSANDRVVAFDPDTTTFSVAASLPASVFSIDLTVLDGRIWYGDQAFPSTLNSVALDGSDHRVDVDDPTDEFPAFFPLTVTAVGTYIYIVSNEGGIYRYQPCP